MNKLFQHKKLEMLKQKQKQTQTQGASQNTQFG